MKSQSNVTAARILVGALCLSLMLVAYFAHREYSSELSEKIEEAVVEYLPDMENGLAKL